MPKSEPLTHAEISRKGGQSRSAKKLAQANKNLALARQRRHFRKKSPGKTAA